MPFADSSNPVLMGVVSFLLLTLALYFSRAPAHRAILSLSRAFYHGLRLAANSLMSAQQRLDLRNREVLLEAGREASERMIEREFERVDEIVRRDLAQCPALEREMKEFLTQLEEDHKSSTDVPPEPPKWTGVVEAVAKIPGKADPTVSNILEQIHESLVKAQEKAIDEYRNSIQARHQHLKTMMPLWRSLEQLSGQLNKNVMKLFERTKVIDRYMENYENIQNKTDRAVRALSTSSLHQFFVSALVLVIAIGGAIINFHLIARPMAEMVGGNSSIGAFKTSDIAALVIILVEVSIGIFMMESLRITRLFPMIGALPDKLRVRMIWITFGILFSLASVEAGLAYMREILVQDALLTNAALRGAAAASGAAEYGWITTMAQMGMGFILPFALVFAAIPLENFIFSLRTVLGIATGGLLRSVATLFRVTGSVFRHSGNLLVNVYDMLIFGPLWIEQTFRPNGERTPRVKKSDRRGGPTLPDTPTVKGATS